MSLSDNQRAIYTPIIDGLLKASNLEEVSAKKIRDALQRAVGPDDDLSAYKNDLKTLIHQRFDVIQAAAEKVAEPPTTNGASPAAKSDSSTLANGISSSSPPTASEEPEERPKKKQKKAHGDSDAALAARLQAEENGRSRPTRNGHTRKKAAPAKNKKNTKKRKSAAKVTEDDDSAEGSASEKPKRKPGGAFNAPFQLSEPLAALLGAQQLSRPQTVKKIWEHIKGNNLQHENDKRQIRCDEGMYAVFHQENVHMFSMNKTLGKHLYPIPADAANGDM